MSSDSENEQHFTLAIFSVAAGMIGVCLTGIGLLQVVGSVRKLATWGDELLALDAIMFLGCCLLAFLSFRVPVRLRSRMRKWADGMFFVGLLLMVIICALITSWFL